METTDEDEMPPPSEPDDLEPIQRQTNDVKSTHILSSHDVSSLESFHLDNSPDCIKNASDLSNPKTFCDACKIQFMSVSTYESHKMSCESKHENKVLGEPLPYLESARGGVSIELSSASDAFTLSGDVSGGIGMATSVIQTQTQAISVLVSTNPLKLVPCILVPEVGLVPQNSVPSTGGPGLQSEIYFPTIVEQLKKQNKISQSSVNDASNDERIMPSSSNADPLKRQISREDGLNLLKQSTDNGHNFVVDFDELSLDSKDSPVVQYSALDSSLKSKKSAVAAANKNKKNPGNSVTATSYSKLPIFGSSCPGTLSGISGISSVHSDITKIISRISPYFTPQVPVIHRLPHLESIRMPAVPPVCKPAAVKKRLPLRIKPDNGLIIRGKIVCEWCHQVFSKYNTFETHTKKFCAMSPKLSDVTSSEASTQIQSTDNNKRNLSNDAVKSGLNKLKDGIVNYQNILPEPQPGYCYDTCENDFGSSNPYIAHETRHCKRSYSVPKATVHWKPDSALSNQNYLPICDRNEGDESSSTGTESQSSGHGNWMCYFCFHDCKSCEELLIHLSSAHNTCYECLACDYIGDILNGLRTHARVPVTEDTISAGNFLHTHVMSETGLIPNILEYSDKYLDAREEIKETLSCFREYTGNLDKMYRKVE